MCQSKVLIPASVRGDGRATRFGTPLSWPVKRDFVRIRLQIQAQSRHLSGEVIRGLNSRDLLNQAAFLK